MAHRRLNVWLLTALGIGALLSIATFAVRSSGEGPKEELAPRPLPVSTMEARMVSSFQTVRGYTGRIVAARESKIAFERPGKVVEVLVDQGERVESGRELARLDTRHLLAQRKQLEANLREALARWDELVAGPRKEQIAAADAEVRNLAAQKQLQELNLKRRATLVKSNAIAQEEYDSARLGLDATSAKLDAAQELLNELRAGTRPEQITAARAAVDQLEASIAEIEHDLDDCVLKAPFAGTVADRFIDEGVVVTPQTAVVRILEDTNLEAWVGLPSNTANQLSVGQNVTMQVASRPVAGRVSAVLPELDLATRTRRVVVEVKSSSGTFPGDVVRLEVPETIETTGYLLPTTALVTAGRGLWSCFAVVSGPDGTQHVERRDVEVLQTSGEKAMVRGTLLDGDSIVANGTHRLANGQLVRSVPATQQQDVVSLSFGDGDRQPSTISSRPLSSSERG